MSQSKDQAPLLPLRRWRLRHQLWALVAAAVAPLLGVQAYLLYRDVIGELNDARHELAVRADHTAAAMQDFLQGTHDLLRGIAERPLVRATDPARCDPLLADFTFMQPRYANTVAVDRAGRVVCSARPQAGGGFVSAVGRDGFERTLRENRPVLTDAFVGPITGRWVAVMTHPLRDANSKPVGLVAVPIDLVHLQPLVSAGEVPPDSEIAVTDAAGVIVARSSDSEKWVGKSVRHLAIAAETRDMEQGTTTGPGIDGIERIYAFRAVAGYQWKVWSGVPSAVVYAGARRSSVNSVLMSLAILAAVGAMTVVLSRRIARPVRQLAKTASSVASGDAQARASLAGPAEIADVAAQFNRMLDAQAAAQARLRENEERLRLAVRAASVGLWELDLATQRVYFSPEWKSQLGYRDDEIANRYEEWESRLHPDDRERVLAQSADYIQAPWPNYATEFRLRHKDGSYRWIGVRADIERDAAGRPTRMRGCHIDITERKQAETHAHELLAAAQRARAALLSLLEDQQRAADALRESEERFGKAFHSSPVGLVISRVSDGRIVEVNEGFEAITGYAREEILGRTPVELGILQPEQHEQYVKLLRETGGARGIEIVLNSKAGDAKHALAAAETIMLQGQPHLIGSLSDITQRKLVEAALRESQRMLATLISNLPGMVYRCRNDTVWTMEFVSEGCKSVTGYERTELERNRAIAFGDLVHPEDREWLWAKCQQALDAHRPCDNEYRILDKSGRTRWVWDRAEGIYGKDGKLLRIEGFVQDITDAKQAALALRQSEQRLRDLIDGLGPSIFVGLLTPAGVLLEANQPALAAFGLKREEVLGKPFADLYPWAESPANQRQLREAIARAAGGEPSRYDVRLHAPENRLIDLDFSLQPLRDQAGKVAFLVPSGNVITERKRAEEALRQSQASLEAAQQRAQLGSWEFDPAREAGTWSREMYRLFERDAALGPPTFAEFLDSVHPQDRPAILATQQRVVARGEVAQLEFRSNPERGAVKYFDASVYGITDASGRVVQLAGTVLDITARKQAEEKVQRLNRVYALLSGIDALIVRVRDRDGLFQEACRLAVETGEFSVAWIGLVDRAQMHIRPVAWSGEERGMLQAIKPYLSLHDRPDEERSLATRAVEEKRPVVVNDVERDPRVVLKETLIGREIGALAVFPLLIADEAVGVLVLLSKAREFFDDSETRLLVELAGDISFALDHIDKEERIDYLAYYDSLTGLANRTLFHERLVQFAHTADHARRKLALCMMDLDHFKTVNDALGRQAGDALLVQFAARLAARTGEREQVARLGADRFAIVLLDIKDESDAIQVLERKMSEYLGEPFHVNGTELRIAAKAGVALCPDDGRDADTLFRNAEAALKKAKAGGDRCLFYTEEMTDRVAEKLVLENNLRRALENEEFVLYYQPKADAKDGRITGVEALLRWADPQAGLVLPMHFIPLLEETGMILDVGAWVIARAVQDCEYWRASGVDPLPVAVNVSAVQLRQRDFVDIVRKAVIAAPLPPPLEIEITETVVMNDIERNIGQLKALRALSVDIAIDDFGTGYSSLGYLARLPVQVLKIDLSFISRMLAEADVQTLVSTMISLAHSLRLKVVAEGVETQQQAEVLRELMCDELQGYWIRKPVTREEITELLRNNGPTGGSPPRRSVRANRRGRKN